jgi:hypothetical protein
VGYLLLCLMGEIDMCIGLSMHDLSMFMSGLVFEVVLLRLCVPVCRNVSMGLLSAS